MLSRRTATGSSSLRDTCSVARYITPERREDLLLQESPHALLAFLVVKHELLVEPIRIVSDPTDFTIGGHLYVGLPFEISLLTDEDNQPTTSIRVQNIDRRIGSAIKSVSGRAEVELAVRSTADFDLSQVPRVAVGMLPPVYGFSHFTLSDVEANELMVRGTLVCRDFSTLPWPARSATQSRCPGLFR